MHLHLSLHYLILVLIFNESFFESVGHYPDTLQGAFHEHQPQEESQVGPSVLHSLLGPEQMHPAVLMDQLHRRRHHRHQNHLDLTFSFDSLK